MRALFRITLPAAMVAIVLSSANAQEPAPLLKPVTPPTSSTRVRVATSDERPEFFHIAAKIHDAKKEKTIDIVAAFDSLPGKAFVALKKWKSWGFEVPANRTGVIPELIISGSQVFPKLSKGRDTEIKITNVKVDILEPPADGDTILLCDMLLPINELTKFADKGFETRMYFGDKFMEFTVPNAAVKRLGTGDEGALPEPSITSDKDLIAGQAPSTMYHGIPTFAYASADGHATYKLPDGKNEPVNVGVASTMNWPDGVLMSIGTARGLGLTIEKGKDLKGLGAGFDSTVGKAKLKEFRLGFVTGASFNVKKDLVLKDVNVIVDLNNSNHFVWIGPRFIEKHLTDAVYGCDPSTNWRLSGRLKPEELQDIKTRPVPPKKP